MQMTGTSPFNYSSTIWFLISSHMDWRSTIAVDRNPSSGREPMLRPRVTLHVVIDGVQHW